ncbi:VWFA and cache domain-containing protein 1 [Trichonephila clavata]|uniref:VWFA and cache domain-containing protein 1 n=1 Tax=Trichonephila clavata TaxID=2740835 RepID=A0A8X6J3R1_TRICU|nr:VWFA and cache domain-containing protein 1 [Trichonephila clavata]
MLLVYEKDTEELSNQKQYVVRLNAKVLAHERERLEKSIQKSFFNSPGNGKHFSFAQGSYFLDPGKSIGVLLRRISNDELCVTKMQAIYDSLPTSDVVEDLEKILNEISLKLSRKLKEYLSTLSKNKQYIESVIDSPQFHFEHTDIACCQLQPESLKYNEHFGVDITLDRGCMTFPYSHTPAGLYIGKSFCAAFQVHLKEVPSLLWQYFISHDGAHFEYPGYHPNFNCDQQTDRHRQIYLDTVKSKTKHVIIVIDQGNSLSMLQFGSAKTIGKHILGQLSFHDKILTFGLASDIQYAQGNNCSRESFLYATSETKLELTRFFENLTRKHNATDHVLGFRKIYEIIHEIELKNTSVHEEILVAYVSRGLLSSLIDAKQVLEIISEGNQKSKSHVVINTYALIDDDRPVMYETDFMQDIAQQNFKKYSIHPKVTKKNQKGVMIPVNTTKDISVTIGDIFQNFPNHPSSKPVFSLPYFDSVNKGMVVSISQQVFNGKNIFGITGIDVSLADLTENISYFTNSESLYVFLMDETGIALTHPSFSHPTYTNWHVHTFIWHLEDKLRFQKYYKAMLREPRGQIAVPFKLPKAQSKDESAVEEKVAIYNWKKVEGTPYIVCVVAIEPTKTKKALKDLIFSGRGEFSYHRIDIMPTATSCRHMKQLSSLGATAIFLSASCFKSPYTYIREEENFKTVLGYMTYLKDRKNTISNPGLKDGIRNEVLALAQITSAWKAAAENEEFSNYIVRRFVATSKGVFLVYPATLMDKSYDATRRDWYIRALEHPGKIILTAPYLDVGGAGYVITLSHTIFEGKPNAMHSLDDNIVSVMGIDFTFGYFYKLLLEEIPVCKLDHMICFLLDDKGYLVAHPDLIDPTGRGPVEQQHITHKEPLVANDLLNHRAFVTKKVCASYSDRTIQRYYELNTSLDTVLTNLVHGEHCTKYQVMHVYGTNVFLGIVNQTCDGITAFCPCSMTDRLCLNCHRMEPTECECPCECPLKMDLCSGQLHSSNNHYPTCPHFPELPNLPIVSYNLMEYLKPCYEHHCSLRTESSDCFGVLGCEWCQLESDGVTPLAKKFCTEQRKCFGGVLGSRTPYADEIIEKLPESDFLVIKSNPIGPVAGGLIAIFVLIIICGYFIRIRRQNISHYGPSSPDTNFRMTQLNNEPEEMEPYQEPINPVTPFCRQLIPNVENVVSPYRVPTNYRRPTGGDSDHGYSTMTPHEDTELAPYFEPLLLGRVSSEQPNSQHSLSSGSRTSSPVSCVPSTTCSASPSILKMESGMPSWISPKPYLYSTDPKTRGTYVIAQVQVHSENLD